MLRYLLYVCFFALGSSLCHGQGLMQDSVASMLRKLPLQKEDTNKVILLKDIAYAYSGMNPEEGVKHAKSALRLSEKLGYREGISQAFNALGLSYNNKSDFSNALKYHFKALELRETMRDSFDIAVTCSNIGIVYDAQQDYQKALEYYERALKIFRQIGDMPGIAANLANLGLLHTSRSQYDQALSNLMEALQIVETLKDTAMIASCIGNIGNVYLHLKDYERALNYDLQSLELTEKIGDPFGTGIGHCNVGELYQLIATDPDDRLLKKLFNGNKKAALELSIINLEKSIRIFRDVGFLNGIQEANKYLSTSYELKGEHELALKTLRQHISMRDSIFNEETATKIANLESRRVSDLKQKEIEIQKLQIQKAEKDKWAMLGGIVILLLLSIILYNRFRLKKKSNRELQTALLNLQATQEQLIEQEKLASLGALAAGIAHEIQNPLNFVNNFSDVSTEMLQDLAETKNESERNAVIGDLKNNLDKISHHGKRASSIIRNMLMHSRKESGHRQLTDINALLDEALSLSFHTIQARYQGFRCNVEKHFSPNLPMVNIVTSDVSRVALNIFNNAFYALHEKMISEPVNSSYLAKLEITTALSGHHVQIIIHDNGSGIPDHIMQNIFEPFFTSKPSNEGTGLGLSISYDIIKSHGGEITVDNKKGTTFTIVLPVS